jgi:hypothetical protein
VRKCIMRKRRAAGSFCRPPIRPRSERMSQVRSPHRQRIPPLIWGSGLFLGIVILAGCGALLPRSSPEFPAAIADLAPPTPLVLAEDAGKFVGSDACKSCHEPEFGAHAQSVHSRTVFRGDSPESKKVFGDSSPPLRDRALGASYTFLVQDGQPLSRVQKRDGVVEMRPSYLIGSGKYGQTPVYERDGLYTEGRASYYPTMSRWFWTPGQVTETYSRQPEGRRLGMDETMACFLCHGTVIAQSDTEALGPGTRLDIGCERCHGPGKDHILAARAGVKDARAIHTYRQASASTVMNLCTQCHRRPVNGAGDEIALDRNLPRFAGTALAASRCYKQSPGKMSCVTCHDPHAPVSHDAGSYERVCLSCHQTAEKRTKACPVNPRSGCIPCHMPSQGIDMPGGARFHNHWIKPYDGKAIVAK